jgi:hypothetical protein
MTFCSPQYMLRPCDEDRVAAAKGKRDEGTLRRLEMASRKQDRLLYVCFYLLLNLSEDPR